MDIPVLLEPISTGWRATTGAPLNLVAEGSDRDGVLANVRSQVSSKLTAGASIASVSVPVATLDIAEIRRLAAEMSANPFFDEWMKGIAEYRAEVNVPPEPDEDESTHPLTSAAGIVVGQPGVAPTAGS